MSVELKNTVVKSTDSELDYLSQVHTPSLNSSWVLSKSLTLCIQGSLSVKWDNSNHYKE